MDALEERARSDLGMIARNETFYQVVPPHPNTAARTPTRTASVR
jgi:cell division protein FtsB